MAEKRYEQDFSASQQQKSSLQPNRQTSLTNNNQAANNLTQNIAQPVFEPQRNVSRDQGELVQAKMDMMDETIAANSEYVDLPPYTNKVNVAQEIPLFNQTADDFNMIIETNLPNPALDATSTNSPPPSMLLFKQIGHQNDESHNVMTTTAAGGFDHEDEDLEMEMEDEELEDEDVVDREEEERAVADIVSAIELHNGKLQQTTSQSPKQDSNKTGEHSQKRRGQDDGGITSLNDIADVKEEGDDIEEEDEISRQFSVDDVSDDEDDTNIAENHQNNRQTKVDKEPVSLQKPTSNKIAAEAYINQRNTTEQRNDKSGLMPSNVATSTLLNMMQSTTCDSQQSSNKNDCHHLQMTSETHNKNDGTPIEGGVQSIANSSTTVKQQQVQQQTISPRKVEPTLNREDILTGHIQKFLAHVETREIGANACPETSRLRKNNATKQTGQESSGSSTSRDSRSGSSSHSSSNSRMNHKDNEDPNAKMESQFDPKELREQFDGWSLYKKTRISFAPVRRYQCLVDQDYKKNKVTVCAHLQNIYNSYVVKRGRPTYQMNNFFDIEKWQSKMGNSHLSAIEKPIGGNSSPTKELRRVNTFANMMLSGTDEGPRERENYLLTKSNSTAHIPDTIRNTKNAKRAYGNFDKDLAAKMFGYRVLFKKRKMRVNVPEPETSQLHKPIHRYVNDIMSELSQGYHQLHRFHTKQRILIPVPEDGLESDEEPTEMTIIDQQQQQPQQSEEVNSTADQMAKLDQSSPSGKDPKRKAAGQGKKEGELVVLRTRNGERQTFLKRTKNLVWHCAAPVLPRQQSAISNSHTKRANYAAKQSGLTSTTIYGGNGQTQHTLNQGQSPGKGSITSSISPKKTIGWGQGGLSGHSNQKQTSLTTNHILAKMNQVRYALPRQGTSHPPASSIRLQAGGQSGSNYGQPYGGAGGTNFRRQNSYRKQHQKSLRGDSAKGIRGMRQSSESGAGAGPYRNPINTSEHNFILHDGYQQKDSSIVDSEVANITNNQQNIVKLHDPKHIEGFGSDIVHVNVSCSQTMPEQQNTKETNKTEVAGEEEEDSQTFVIQLSEEQTKQLSSGTLKLNGVPIPKDLSNLSYEQIMALLDSVNLPPQKGTSSERKQPSTTQKETVKSTPITDKSRVLDQQLAGSCETAANRKNQTIPGRGMDNTPSLKPGVPPAKYASSSFKQTNQSRFMGHTFSGGTTATANVGGHGITPMSNHEFFRSQQAQYGLGSNLTTTADPTNMPPKQCSSVIDQQEPIRMKQAGRDIAKQNNLTTNGATRQNSHPTATQALQQRLAESSNSQNHRMTRQQAASQGTTKKNVLVGADLHQHQQHQQQLRTQHNNSQLSQHHHTNAANRNQAMVSNSDWDMLAMIGKQSQQLKTTQNLRLGAAVQQQAAVGGVFSENSGRKTLYPTSGHGHYENVPATSSSTKQQNQNNLVSSQTNGYKVPQAGGGGAFPGINSIKHSKKNNGPLFHHNHQQQQAPPPFIEFDPNQFVKPNGTAQKHNHNSHNHNNHNTNNVTRQSQQMIQQQKGVMYQPQKATSASAQPQNHQQQADLGSSTIGLNNIRLQHPHSTAAANQSHVPMIPTSSTTAQQQSNSQNNNYLQNHQRSIARLESKKVANAKKQQQTPVDLQGSSSRGFLKTGGLVTSTTTSQQTNQASARMQNQVTGGTAGMSKVKSASTAATQNTGASAARTSLFPPGGGAKLINTNHHHQYHGHLLNQGDTMLLNAQHSAPQHMAYHVISKGNSPPQHHNSKPYSDLISADLLTANPAVGGSQGTQKRVSNESLPLGVQLLNRYYQSGADKIHKKVAAVTTSTPSSTNGPPLKQSSFTAVAKSKISKTSIELEYSKFDHPRGITKSHLPSQQPVAPPKILSGSIQPQFTSNQQSRKNLLHHSHERASGVSTTQYYQRMVAPSTATETASDMIHSSSNGANGGKLRLMQQQMQNNYQSHHNTNGTNQSGISHKHYQQQQAQLQQQNMQSAQQQQQHQQQRKIESALAQSAINAIQSQSIHHHLPHHHHHIIPTTSHHHQGGGGGGASSPFLKFEQKAFSQPQNQVIIPPTHNANGGIQAAASPPFIMRNTLNKSSGDHNHQIQQQLQQLPPQQSYAQQYAMASALVVNSSSDYSQQPQKVTSMISSSTNATKTTTNTTTTVTTKSPAGSRTNNGANKGGGILSSKLQ